MKFIVITFFLSYLISVFFNLELDVFIKPLLMPLLLIYVSFQANVFRNSLVITALFFSTIGDSLLIFEGNLFFIGGLGAFLVAQICYIVIFFKGIILTHKISFKIVPALLLIAYLIAILSLLIPNIEKSLLVLVFCYAITISMMLYFAIHWRIDNPQITTKYVVIGAGLFVISDSLLAISKFKNEFNNDHFLVMLTYLLAQFLIISGLTTKLKKVKKPR